MQPDVSQAPPFFGPVADETATPGAGAAPHPKEAGNERSCEACASVRFYPHFYIHGCPDCRLRHALDSPDWIRRLMYQQLRDPAERERFAEAMRQGRA